MAYVLKYKVEYKTNNIGQPEGLIGASNYDAIFEIEELDPANATVITLNAGNAPLVDQAPDKESKDCKLISTKCIVNIKNTDQYSKLINFVTEDERKFRGTLKVNGVVKFRGWLLTDVSSTNEIFNAKVSDLQLTFTDGIGTLENQEYVNPTNGQKLFGKASIIEILSNINQITGLELDLFALANFTAEKLTSGRILEKQKISQLRFFNADRTPFSCKKVLEYLCIKDFAMFFQREGAFWFVPFSQNLKATRVYNKYNNLGVYQSDVTINTYKSVADNGDIYLGAKKAQRNYLAPYKKCSINTVFNQGYLFENEGLEYFNTGSSDPVYQIKPFQGLESQINNVTFPNWTMGGTFKVSVLTYSEAYMGALKDKWFRSDAVTKFGAFPYNNKVLVAEKSESTVGANLVSSKMPFRKGTKIRFQSGTGHNLFIGSGASQISANDIVYKVFLVTNVSSVLRYVLTSAGKWVTEFATTTGLETKYIQAAKRNSLVPAVQLNSSGQLIGTTDDFITIINSSVDSEPAPIDGYLQIEIGFPPSGASTNDIYQFQAPIVTITEQPKGIDKVTYESTITGKHTVIPEALEVPFCDNSVELIPCSVFDQDGNETDKYSSGNIVNDHLLILPLLERQVQFSKSFLKVNLPESFSHNLQVGDVFKFDFTGFSDMSSKEFLVIGILNRDYRTGKMHILACEIIESANNITYDIFIYNQGFKEAIRKDVPFDSENLTDEGLPPWTWTNIS